MPPLTLGIGQIDGRDGGTDEERPKQNRRELEPVLADDTDDVTHPDAGQRPETLGQPHGLLQQFQILHFRSVHAVNLRNRRYNSYSPPIADTQYRTPTQPTTATSFPLRRIRFRTKAPIEPNPSVIFCGSGPPLMMNLLSSFDAIALEL